MMSSCLMDPQTEFLNIRIWQYPREQPNSSMLLSYSFESSRNASVCWSLCGWNVSIAFEGDSG